MIQTSNQLTSALHTDILILGAGIGGYETFRTLAKELRRHGINKKITIVDQNNYFTFIPLMHEVAVGEVEPEHCTLALREIVAGTPHEFIKARVKKIDPKSKAVALECAEAPQTTISYDYCVVALGSAINYFDIPGAKDYTYHLRSLENALAFRNALINRYDSADKSITISVIGGGPTGVEAAGHIAHLVHGDLKRLYPHKPVTVRLIERGGELVTFFPKSAQALISKRLKKLGVELLLNTGVHKVEPDALALSSGATIESDLTLWAVGMRNLADDLFPPEFCTKGCILVTNNLMYGGLPTLYAVGDIAMCFDEKTDKRVPQLGEAAHKQGQYVGRHLAAVLRGKKIKPFSFTSKGSIMPIGENYGLMVRGKFVWAGFFMWWVRRTVYVWFMPGILRKIKIIVDWTLRLFGIADIITIENKQKTINN